MDRSIQMAQPIISWIMPLVLLPGVALLIMSTSIRYGQIHDELHHILQQMEQISPMFRQHLLTRARLFRNALVTLYVSVGLFALGSMGGAVTELMRGPDEWVVIGFTFVGIVALILAAVFLVRESILSLQVIGHHLDMLDD